MLPPLYAQGKRPLYPLDRRLGGPQSQSGHGGEEKNFHPIPGLKPLIIQPVAQHCTLVSKELEPNQIPNQHGSEQHIL
jgi:hypothetical protein